MEKSLKQRFWSTHKLLPLILAIAFGILVLEISAQTSSIKKLEQQLAQTTQDSVRLRLHFEMASEFYSITPQQVFQHVDSMLVLSKRLNKEVFIYRALYLRAVAHYIKGDLSLAEEVISKVDSSGFFFDDPSSLMDVYNLMGTVLSSRGKVSRALDYQYKALEIARKLLDDERQITALSNIAQTYTDNLDTIKSMDYYQEALNMAESISDTVSIAVINNNLSGVTQNPELKIKYARRALSLFNVLEYADGIAHASNELATGLRQKELYEQALGYLHHAISIWQSSGFKQGLVSAYTNMGVNYGYTTRLDSAEYYFDLATELGDILEDKIIPKQAFEEMAGMYEKMDQPALALRYLKRAAQLRDLLYSQERAQQLAVAETDFKSREKERKLGEQQLLIEKQKNTQTQVIVGGSIILLFVLGWLQYLRYRHQIKRKDAELALGLEKADTEKLRELDRLKSVFFTNISHEFRTPLTLIQTPLKHALDHSANQQSVVLPWQHASNMESSAQQLLQLVNRLLDLAKLESGKMQLSVAKGDLTQCLRSIAYGFESLALSKQINYHVIVPSAPVLVWYDQEIIRHILSNLLANAFKFTLHRGRIFVEATFKEDEVEILVGDNGVGISLEELPLIFNRFFSNTQTAGADGSSSGVGLALTRELVHLHKGTIRVESEKDVGSTFVVTIPTSMHVYSEDQISESASTNPDLDPNRMGGYGAAILVDGASAVLGSKIEKPWVLIVEDNQVLRDYIAAELSMHFNVTTAIHGIDGLKKATATIPDLIITDVMMPELDGIEFCKQLRQQVATSHIPIIMLTAKADRQGKLTGLEIGADEYLTKPFDQQELLIRSKNLIAQRALLKKRFAGNIIFKPSEVASNSVDEDFLSKILQAIEENMEVASFGVEDLGNVVALSRSQLHRKLKAIADKSPNELIRSMRLQRAHELLKSKTGSASEIAYQVGFSSLSYFSKCFKDQFGFTPSEVEHK